MGMFIGVCINSEYSHRSISLFACKNSVCRVGFKNMSVSQHTPAGPGSTQVAM